MDNNRRNNKDEIVVEIEDYNQNENKDNHIIYSNIGRDLSLENNNQEPVNEEIDRDLRDAEERFEIPLHLKKTFICSTILFIVGCLLIGIGFIEEVRSIDPTEGIAFWILGGIILIPGGYYSYQFFKAIRSRDEQVRDDILNDIPEL